MYVFYKVKIVSASFFNRKKSKSAETAVPAVTTSANGKPTASRVPSAVEGDYVGVPSGIPRR